MFAKYTINIHRPSQWFYTTKIGRTASAAILIEMKLNRLLLIINTDIAHHSALENINSSAMLRTLSVIYESS